MTWHYEIDYILVSRVKDIGKSVILIHIVLSRPDSHELLSFHFVLIVGVIVGFVIKFFDWVLFSLLSCFNYSSVIILFFDVAKLVYVSAD